MKHFSLIPDDNSSNTNRIDDERILKGLNGQQHSAVTHPEGPLLIIAGAGSGKTRVLTNRIAWLLHSRKVYPNQILALTFTNKAAGEMRERIEDLVGESAKRIWIGTFHSIFAKILRFEAEQIGFRSSFSIYDTEDGERTIKLIMKEQGVDIKNVKPRTIRNKISTAKNQLITPTQFRENFITSIFDDIAAQVFPVYEERLRNNNAMDFDDLLIKPIELFQKHPDVLDRYQDRFRQILIDEYQDTNHAQYVVTKMLADKFKQICVVGDDAQSIYSFRGADISNILNFQKDYPEAVKIPLEQNYRSTKLILKAADSVIKQNTKQLEKNLWTDKEMGEPITVITSLNERDEAQRVAYHIENLRLRKGLMPKEIAILYRTNYQSRLFEEALRKKNINYQLVGGVSFYQRKEVKDVFAYLKLLVNPDDEESLLRILNVPTRGIGGKTEQLLIQEARRHGTSVARLIENPSQLHLSTGAKNSVTAFSELISETRKLLKKDTSLKAAQYLLNATGYLKQFVEDNTQESLNRRDNVVEFLNALDHFEKNNPDLGLEDFLQDISLMSDVDSMDNHENAVTLMSIHASKGLEYPVVFIAGLEEDLFPIKRADNDVDIEEERRLFYVAVTRAQKELYLSFTRSRYKFGEDKLMFPSRFLNEIDESILRTETGATYRHSKHGKKSQSGYNSYSPNVRYFDDGYSKKQAGSSFGKRWTPSNKGNNKGDTRVEYDSASYSDYRVGSMVIHPKFGSGKIISRDGTDDKTKVTVFFKDKSQRTLLLKFANLTLIR